MTAAGTDDRIFPVTKLAMLVNSLAKEGATAADALRGVNLSPNAISLPATRVSMNQIVETYRNATRLAQDPHFAYRTGLRFHISTYGMYGFAILSGMDFRATMDFAVKYHALATPLAEISFSEERGSGTWTIVPLPHPRVDAAVSRFIVELQFGIHVSLHRDIMGPAFAPKEVHVTYDPPDHAPTYPEVFGCRVLFGQPENRLLFDAAWLDGTPQLGNELIHLELVKLCGDLLEAFKLRIGLAGKVREILLLNLGRPTKLEAVARDLHMTTRTLRRKLHEENTSFRALADELRMHTAIKYLRDTDLTIDDIAHALGFSDEANFRHAFRRWTKRAPLDYRELLRNGTREAASAG